MKKSNGKGMDSVQENIKKLKEIFPEAFVEGELDFDALRQIFGVAGTSEERYSLKWNGKSEARQLAQEASAKTLRPSKEESKNWDSTENIYIEGDNLEALKLLQKSHYGKIDAIYIDPPYNTGNDIIYKNNYSCHDSWLSMMSSRMLLAKSLLASDGIICISIDHHELYSLGLLCNEIFGEDNRIGMITVVNKPEGRNQEKFFATSTEYALFYAKNKADCKFNPIILDDESKKTFDREDAKGKYRLNNYIRLGGGNANLRKNKPHFY